jgi:tetratricopeptide (TPR) repeat protein
MHPLLINALRSPCHHADPDIQRLLDKARKILEEAPASAERYATELVAGKTLAECLGIENQTLEDSYQGACKLVDQGLFQEALILAGLAMAIGPKNAKAAFKLASCMQHLGDLASATDYYKLALQIDQHHIGAAYRLGECLQMLDDEAGATHLFEWTIELARGNVAHRKIQVAAESRLRKQPLLP